MQNSQHHLLQEKRFLPLFLTQFFGAFNDNAFKNALVILITYRAAQTAGMDPRLLVTAAAGAFILPFFLFSALAGELADRFDKARLIRIIKAIEIALMLAAAVGFIAASIPALMVVLFFAGVHSSFFGPLKYSILPDLLHEDALLGANALVEAGTFLAILLGTIAGGVLVLQAQGAVAISALLFAVALAGWFAARHIPATQKADNTAGTTLNPAPLTWRILRQATTNRTVFFSILGISWFWLVGFTFLAQLPAFAKNILGADADVVTLFLTLFSVGIGVGSMICNTLLKGKISARYTPHAAAGMAGAIFALCFISTIETPAYLIKSLMAVPLLNVPVFLSTPLDWVLSGCLFLIAVFGGIYIVPLYTLMQTHCEKSHRSRIIAANNIWNALFMVAGALATMALLKTGMTTIGIFHALGGTTAIVAVVAALLTRKQPV